MNPSRINLDVLFRVAVRAVHLLSTMFMLSVLALECLFDLDKDAKLQEQASFKRACNVAGIAMIGSGVLLTTQVSRSDALPSQN